MKLNKSKIKNIIFFVLVGLLLIPQTRLPIKVMLHKSLALFSPSIIDTSKQNVIENYNWILENKNGAALNFEEARGKVILINFWATWCPPCIAEMPSMQLLYDDYKDKIEFVFVSNESFSVINEFMDKNEYTFEVFNSITKYPEDFDVSSIPRTFLIDKKGNMVIDKVGAANWNSKKTRKIIDELLL